MSKRPLDDARPPRLSPLARNLSGADLGSEQPLNAGGAAAQVVDRHHVNLRWLGASILTGVAGAGALGGAGHVSVEGVRTSAEVAERVTAPPRPRSDQDQAISAA